MVRKGIVPAAGMGRRLWPVSRFVPKAMFPVGNYPAIHWVIAEAIASGCTQIAVVVSPHQPIIRDYLSREAHVFDPACRLTFIDQPEPLGLGHALLLSRDFVGEEPAAILLPDELTAGGEPPLRQMSAAFRLHGGIVFALVSASPEGAAWSQRWHLNRVDERLYAVRPRHGVGRPQAEGPSLVGAGRYLMAPECLNGDLQAQLLNRSGAEEIDDGMILEDLISRGEPVHGLALDGGRFDIATRQGYIEAWRTLASSQPDLI